MKKSSINSLNLYPAKKIVSAAIYASDTLFASTGEFLFLFKDKFVDMDASKEDVLREIGFLIKKLSSNNKKIGQREASRILVADDLERIAKTVKRLKIGNPQKQLERFHKLFLKKFKDIGFKTRLPKYYVVKNLPKPYDFDSAGVIFDWMDEKEYGVPQGAYLKEDYLSPIYAPKTLGHELVHLIISEGKGGGYPYLLEEGICDLIGGFYLLTDMVSRKDLYNLFVHSGLSQDLESMNTRYKEGMRLASVVYKSYGLRGIIYIIKAGREEIERVEKAALGRHLNKIKIPRGHWSDELDDFTTFFLSYPSNLIFSPLAILLAKKLKVGMNLRDCIELGFKPEETKKALKELGERGPLLFAYGKVTSDQSKRFLKGYVLRYKIPKNLKILN